MSKPVCTVNGHTCQGKRSDTRRNALEERWASWPPQRNDWLLAFAIERERVTLFLDGSPEYTVKERGVKQKMSLRHFHVVYHAWFLYLKVIDRDSRSILRFWLKNLTFGAIVVNSST